MHISGDAEEVQLKQVAEEKDTTFDKTRQMQISGNTEKSKLKDVAKEKDTPLKVFNLA